MPRKMCNRNGSINSSIPLGKLLRLREYLHDDHGQAQVCLSFDRDESGYCRIQGTVKAVVNMLCQRCLENTAVTLASDLALRVADNDAEAELIAQASTDPLERLEIVVCEDGGELDLLSVVEDELIMSLPIVASHPDDHCSKVLNTLQREDGKQPARLGNIKGLDALEKLRAKLQQGKDNNE